MRSHRTDRAGTTASKFASAFPPPVATEEGTAWSDGMGHLPVVCCDARRGTGRPRQQAGWRICPGGLALTLLLALLPDAVQAQTGKPWEDMDYGPFLTVSIEAPKPEGNLAYKGIAIRLGDAFGGTANEAVTFDTDLLRYSAGWTGGFVALKGVVFDGEHWAYPRIAGDQVFGNPNLPGWARAGSFDDPREHPYGPVPDDWAHWEGLSLHGGKVVLQYTVGDMTVLELPGLERRGETTAFSRTFNLGPSTTDQIVQIAFEEGRQVVERLESEHSPSIAVMAPRAVEQVTTSEPGEGLLRHFTFDEETEFAADAIETGAEAEANSVRWTDEGFDGGGVEFDGESWLELPETPETDFLENDLTVAAWIKTGRNGTILSKTAPEGPWVRDGKTFFVRGGRLAFDIGWVGAVSGRTPVADDRWHHVAFSHDHRDGTVRLYVDGAPDGEGELQPNAPVSGHVVRLGFTAENFPGQPWFHGLMDDVRIYGRRLASAEIASLAGREPPETGSLAAAIVGTPDGSRWAADAPGHLRLFLPASGEERRFKVLIWRGAEEAMDEFAALARSSSPAEDLRSLTQGGPPRWPEKLVTRGKLGGANGAYAVDTITGPDDNPWKSWLRFGGVDFFSDSRRAAICTWNGDVWTVDGIDGNLETLTWQRIATGLFQPLGLKVVNDEIYVLGRDQITRLHDLNGDGEADFYENFNNDCMASEHFHEFATDLKTDSQGNFWYIKCACHAVKATHPHHGTVMRLPPDGSKLEVVARGLRAVNGLGVGPNDEILCVDNQGHWMPGNRINWVKPGGWYGNQFAWNPDNRETYDEPLCWMHNSVDRSGGTFVWVPDRRWGNLAGEIISISYGMGYLTIVLPEEVDGVMQGGVTRFPMEFDTGVMRGVFHPVNGQLYTCGLYGWAGNKTKAGGFYRVRYTGRPVNLPNELHVASDGLVVGFTDPLAPASATDPGNYDLKVWNLHWSATYGSPDFKLNGQEGRDTWTVESAALSADRRSVFLKVPEIQPVMQSHLVFNLRTEAGDPLRNFVHHTIHKLGAKPGAELIGTGTVAAVRTEEVRLGEEAPGLLQTLTSLDDPAVTDTRVARLAATHVTCGTAPSPWLPPGKFRSTWRGYLKSDLNDEMRFHLAGIGQAVLRLNGQEVVRGELSESAGVASEPVAVKRGLNRFELQLFAPADQVDAAIRLSWKSARIPLEPVPATAFVHDASLPEARQAVAIREGRALFGSHLCVKCHQPVEPFMAAMPELEADTPSFDGLGGRLDSEWIAGYLVDPKAVRPDGRMPQVLGGEAMTVAQDVADIAAFLSGDAPVDPAETADGPASGEGAALFAELGCVGCHRLEGDAELPGDSRTSLAHVPAKWRRSALPEFLKAPDQHYAWTRMPTFPLTDGEAVALADHLLNQEAVPLTRLGSTRPASPDRGRELVQTKGCLACHSLTGYPQTAIGPTLAELEEANWQEGCLAGEGEARGEAPDFAFTETQREALRVFAASGGLESLHRRVPVEFAARQYPDLRCNACHVRDGEPDVWTQVSARAGGEGSGGTDDGEEATGSVHVGRPLLSFAGEKLHAGWMARFLTGELEYKPRSERQGFMPAFPAQGGLLANGLAQEHGYSATHPRRSIPNPALADIGQQLTLVGNGFGCVSCHDVESQPALAGADTAAVNFAFVADRILPDYYRRYLQDPQRLVPGTMMPAFIGADGRTPITLAFDGDPDRQFGAIWEYLLSLDPASAAAIQPAPTSSEAPVRAAPTVDYE